MKCGDSGCSVRTKVNADGTALPKPDETYAKDRAATAVTPTAEPTYASVDEGDATYASAEFMESAPPTAPSDGGSNNDVYDNRDAYPGEAGPVVPEPAYVVRQANSRTAGFHLARASRSCMANRVAAIVSCLVSFGGVPGVLAVNVI